MAITRVGFVSLASGTNTGWTCAIPAGAAAGDVAYVAIAKATNAVPTTVPTGYVALDTPLPEGTTNNFTWWYAKVLGAGDPGTNHVWAWASTTGSGACLILRGADNAQVLDVTDPPTAVAGSNVTTVNAPTTTTLTAGAVVIWTATVGTAGTQAFPATLNGNTVTRELGSASGILGLAWALYPTAGAVSAAAVTLSASTRVTAKTLAAKAVFVAVLPARVTQETVEVLRQPTAQRARVTQTAVAALVQPTVQRARVSQLAVEALYDVASLPAPTGDAIQRWTGSAWQTATVRRWDGSAWVIATVKRWDGGNWV